MLLPTKDFIVFGGLHHAQHDFDKKVLALINQSTSMNLGFSHISSGTCPDGERNLRLTDHKNIKGKHALILATPTTDRLELETDDVIVACKNQYEAKTITLALSFLRYRRQDRPEKRHEINRLRHYLNKLKRQGVDNLIVCEPHNIENTTKFCTECDLPLTIADPVHRFAEAMNSLIAMDRNSYVVYSPDKGSVGRSIAFAEATNTSVIVQLKHRTAADTVEVGIDFDERALIQEIRDTFKTDIDISCNIDDVLGKHAIMVEDEISTSSTAIAGGKHLRKAGAASVIFKATHAVCTPGWGDKLFPGDKEQPFESVWLGNTRPRGIDGGYRESTNGKIHTVDVSPAMTDAIVKVLNGVNTHIEQVA